MPPPTPPLPVLLVHSATAGATFSLACSFNGSFDPLPLMMLVISGWHCRVGGCTENHWLLLVRAMLGEIRSGGCHCRRRCIRSSRVGGSPSGATRRLQPTDANGPPVVVPEMQSRPDQGGRYLLIVVGCRQSRRRRRRRRRGRRSCRARANELAPPSPP